MAERSTAGRHCCRACVALVMPDEVQGWRAAPTRTGVPMLQPNTPQLHKSPPSEDSRNELGRPQLAFAKAAPPVIASRKSRAGERAVLPSQHIVPTTVDAPLIADYPR